MASIGRCRQCQEATHFISDSDELDQDFVSVFDPISIYTRTASAALLFPNGVSEVNLIGETYKL